MGHEPIHDSNLIEAIVHLPDYQEVLVGSGVKLLIDGVAASGKGLLAEQAAGILQMEQLNTGDLYRGVAHFLLSLVGPDVNGLTDTQLGLYVRSLDIRLAETERGRRLIVSNQLFGELDVTNGLRVGEVEEKVSKLSARGPVRDVIETLQQKLVAEAKNGMVIEGRDMYTLPRDADTFRVYLYADDEELARREVRRQKAQGVTVTFEDALEAIQIRNKQDMSRDRNPLLLPEDARESGLYDLVLNTTHMKPYEVLDAVLMGMVGRKLDGEERVAGGGN